jgi:hypothetical protein
MIARTFVSTGWVGLLAVAASVALILLVLLGLYERRIRHGAAMLTATKVIIPTWYGRRRGKPDTSQLLLIGGGGNRLLRLVTAGIPRQDVMAFAAALLVPVDVRQERLDPQQLSQDYPGSAPWGARHPAAVGLLIALVIIVIVVGVVVGLAAAGVIHASSG